MNLATHAVFGARNSFRFTDRLATVGRSGLKSALLAAALGFAPPARAQNAPHIGYVYPAGGRQGATFEIVVGGQYLGSVSNAFVSGDGCRAKVMEYNRPLNQKEFNELRDRLKELQDKQQSSRKSPNPTNSWTTADERVIKETRATILKNPPNRQANPAIAETITARITLSTNAEPGEREVRLAAPNGLSNPLVFRVGQLPEVSKPAAKFTSPDMERFLERLGRKSVPAKFESRITLPAVVNGQILPGAVDRYRFFAREGQRLVAAVSARELIPYLPDAVPGWFQATLALYDAKGRELAYNDHYRFNPDPVLSFEIAHDGEYVIEIKDSLYRGREDFVYRIAVGELPFLTSLFPLGGPAGAHTAVSFTGWNLSASNLTQDTKSFVVPPSYPFNLDGAGDPPSGMGAAFQRNRHSQFVSGAPVIPSGESSDGTGGSPVLPAANAGLQTIVRQEVKFAEPGVYQLSASNGERISNLVPFAVDTLPECLDQETNNSPATAQPVTLPIIVNGRIDQPGDTDVFRFEGRASSEIVAEIIARRLNSPLDSVLRLTDSAGRQIAFNDDNEDKGAGLETHHADSYLRITLPADGTYYIHLADAQLNGGPEYSYRLRISPPRPDFALRVVPSSLSVRAGASVPLTAYAVRRDGFTNAITLVLKDAPEGFELSGACIPENQDKVRFTLTAPDRRSVLQSPEAASQTGMLPFSLEGWGVVGGKAIFHPAVPAEDMMQAFAYRHLVPAREFAVAVAGRGMPPVRILSATPVKLPAGGTVRVRIGAPSSAFSERFKLELSEPPDGITIKNVSPIREGEEIELAADAAKIKPGLTGNLIVNAFVVVRPPEAEKGKAQANNRRPAAGTLPAMPFEIIGSVNEDR